MGEYNNKCNVINVNKCNKNNFKVAVFPYFKQVDN